MPVDVPVISTFRILLAPFAWLASAAPEPSARGDPADNQSRYNGATVNGVLIATLYAPNGNKADATDEGGYRRLSFSFIQSQSAAATTPSHPSA